MVDAPPASSLLNKESLIIGSTRARSPSSSGPTKCIRTRSLNHLHPYGRIGSAWYAPSPLPSVWHGLDTPVKKFSSPVGRSPFLKSSTQLGAQAFRQIGGSRTASQEMAAVKVPPKLLTLLIVHKLGKVLLGRKKRGFGEGYYNGFGGKVEPGETIEEAAIREMREEAGVDPVGLERRGLLTFHFDDQDRPWEVHVYHAADVLGEPHETDEMVPTWFAIDEIPFDRMWADDPLWYPIFLQGKRFEGTFYFQNTHTMISHSVQVL